MLKHSTSALLALGAGAAIFTARHEWRESEFTDRRTTRDAHVASAAVTVTGRVTLLGGGGRDADVGSAVVYLEPLAAPRPVVTAPAPAPLTPPALQVTPQVAPRDTVRVLWDAVRELRQTVAELREALRQVRASFLGGPEARAATPPAALPPTPADTNAAPPSTVGATPVNVPTGAPAGTPGSSARSTPRAERVIPGAAIDMRQKTFIPHVRVVEAGGMVEYPNKDPFSHNVFSTTPGGAFDLGLYPRGESRGVVFRRPGVYAIYCNIHSKMSAFVVTVPAAYHTRPQADGRFAIANVPPGRYRLHVWHERAPEQITTVTVADRPVADVAMTLDARTFRETGHLNKFGQQYRAAPRDAY
jgi:plastocyanin